MKIKLFVAVFVLAFLKSFSAQSTAYYPLDIGDFWQYWNTINGDIVTREVIEDTTFPNGYTYAAIQDYMFSTVIYQRTSGDSIFRFNTTNNHDELFYDLSASPGDTINSVPNGSDTTDIILTWTGMRNIFGVDRRHWNFTIDLYRNFIDDEQYHVVADGIGLRSLSIIFFIEAELQGAIINGIQHGTITNIENDVTATFEGFALYPNYPNPFNPTTRIQYIIEGRQFVSLKVYDLLGNEITTLVNEEKPAGEYAVEFDASKLSSGIYFYQLQVGDFIETKKMILMR